MVLEAFLDLVFLERDLVYTMVSMNLLFQAWPLPNAPMTSQKQVFPWGIPGPSREISAFSVLQINCVV